MYDETEEFRLSSLCRLPAHGRMHSQIDQTPPLATGVCLIRGTVPFLHAWERESTGEESNAFDFLSMSTKKGSVPSESASGPAAATISRQISHRPNEVQCRSRLGPLSIGLAVQVYLPLMNSPRDQTDTWQAVFITGSSLISTSMSFDP